MKIDSQYVKKLIEERLDNKQLSFQFDKEKNTLRVEDGESKKGVVLSLPGIVAKYEINKEQAIEEVIYYVEETINAMKKEIKNIQKDKIFPVIRATSFPKKNNQDIEFLTDDHTAETRVYYAEDMGKTYRLLDVSVLQEICHEDIKKIASGNLASLETVVKQDEVAGNIFYFFRTNDGYDASRILNTALLNKYERQIEGTMVVAVPHQDVLIVADIRNEVGYDIIAQMTINFFASGLIPITSLSFLYKNGELEPIFILGKNRKKK